LSGEEWITVMYQSADVDSIGEWRNEALTMGNGWQHLIMFRGISHQEH
jgi:hypothetical protein